VTISGLTLIRGGGGGANAADGFGGAISARGGALYLDRLNITENQTPLGGGGLYLVGGTCTLTNSTVSANASASCAGISSDNASLTVINSTVSGNRAYGGLGGGICAGGVVKIYQTTVTENSAAQRGGGIYQLDGANIVLANSVVAKNIAGAGLSNDVYYEGTVVSIGGNFLGRVAGSFAGNGSLIIRPTDIQDTNSALGALAMNGGTVPTHAPLAGSPLIDAGVNELTTEPFDQRGFLRIVDGNADGRAVVDIGAVELQILPPRPRRRLSGRLLSSF
jgi:hypothetical protein